MLLPRHVVWPSSLSLLAPSSRRPARPRSPAGIPTSRSRRPPRPVASSPLLGRRAPASRLRFAASDADLGRIATAHVGERPAGHPFSPVSHLRNACDLRQMGGSRSRRSWTFRRLGVIEVLLLRPNDGKSQKSWSERSRSRSPRHRGSTGSFGTAPPRPRCRSAWSSRRGMPPTS